MVQQVQLQEQLQQVEPQPVELQQEVGQVEPQVEPQLEPQPESQQVDLALAPQSSTQGSRRYFLRPRRRAGNGSLAGLRLEGDSPSEGSSEGPTESRSDDNAEGSFENRLQSSDLSSLTSLSSSPEPPPQQASSQQEGAQAPLTGQASRDSTPEERACVPRGIPPSLVDRVHTFGALTTPREIAHEHIESVLIDLQHQGLDTPDGLLAIYLQVVTSRSVYTPLPSKW